MLEFMIKVILASGYITLAAIIYYIILIPLAIPLIAFFGTAYWAFTIND